MSKLLIKQNFFTCLVMFMVFACKQVQKSKRPTMSIAKSKGCECEPELPITREAFVSLSNDLLTVERPSICSMKFHIKIDLFDLNLFSYPIQVSLDWIIFNCFDISH